MSRGSGREAEWIFLSRRPGIVSSPIKGFVDATDKDVTVDADLGWLGRLIPAKQTQAAIEGRVKGLLT
jgi:hypothetical protein